MAMSVRCVKSSAEIALSGYKRAGFDVDPRGPDQIAVCCTLRRVLGRVSGQTFMNQLKSQVKDIGVGTKFCMHFWAVPKASWPGGLPPAAADALVPDHQLVDMELRGGATVDSEAYYIVDQVVPREVLGKGLQSLEIYVMNSTRLALPATAQGNPAGAAGSGGGDGGGALEALTDTAHGARGAAATVQGHGT